MADIAKKAMDLWDDLEKDSGTSLRWMSGLLNFGDPNFGGSTPEGELIQFKTMSAARYFSHNGQER